MKNNKPWCIPLFAALILVFTFWKTEASFWVIWISAVLIFIRSICLLSDCCSDSSCKNINNKSIKKKK